MDNDTAESERVATPLRELAALFLRLGTVGFGGPAAHIAMMRDEVVVRRQWLTDERFLDLLGATNLIPGPNSTELAIHIGWERRRWRGLIVAGLAFIVPSMTITGVLAALYVRFGTLPSARALLYGVKPVMVAVVLQAIWGLAPRAMRTRWLRLLALLSALAIGLGAHEIVVLLGAGALAVARLDARDGRPQLQQVAPWLLAGGVQAAPALTLSGLFGAFVKIGSLLFGSGYVLLAFLRSEFVVRLGVLSEAQLIDAVAVGQITPGPVFTTATFIGYVLAGTPGALVATAGIFLPAFVFVALSGPLVPRLRASRTAGAFLDGVNVASLALMAVVTLQLGRAALVDLFSVALALVSGALLVRQRVSATWLITGGAALGLLAHLAR
jgi:chromate transporter